MFLTCLPANKKGTEKETSHFFFSTFAVCAFSIYQSFWFVKGFFQKNFMFFTQTEIYTIYYPAKIFKIFCMCDYWTAGRDVNKAIKQSRGDHWSPDYHNFMKRQTAGDQWSPLQKSPIFRVNLTLFFSLNSALSALFVSFMP